MLKHVLDRLKIRITWLTLLYHFIWHTLITSAAVGAPAPAGTLSLAGVFGERLADNVGVEDVGGGDDALSEAGVGFGAADEVGSEAFLFAFAAVAGLSAGLELVELLRNGGILTQIKDLHGLFHA